jgi:glycosyltransferase involved in cell wall biosynthesis
MNLLITSHVPHYVHGGRYFAYGPYAKEIDLWADLFDEVTIAAPLRHAPPAGDCARFERVNIRVDALPEAGGENLAAKLKLALATPFMIAKLCGAMLKADAIHVRCPGNVGVLAALLAPLFSRRIVGKYAGSWVGAPGEPFTYWLQRRVLGSPYFRGPVTVYGKWPNQAPHVIPFFTSLLSQDHLDRAAAARRESAGPGCLRILYTGRLSKAKNVDCVIEAAARVRDAGFPVRVTVVGEGPERASLGALAARLSMAEAVDFTGGLDFEQVLPYVAQSSVLALTSESEGWPKSIAEGMAFGLVCIGSKRGLVPEILGEGRGITVTPRDVEELAGHLLDLARHPERYEAMRERAAAWARGYTIEGLRGAIKKLLEEKWAVELRTPPQPHNGAAIALGESQ